MLFSVVTVTYNAEKFLNRTLQSVAAQSFSDFEHLIWDGGSKDNTLSIAESYPHVKIHVGKDQGIADAMNKGASLAKGDFILHLHADDFLAHPDVLEMVKKALSLHPWIEWIYGRACIVDENEELLHVTPYEPYSLKRLRKYNFITHPACFVSRNLFNRVGGFNPQLRYAMDYDFWLRCALKSAPFASSSLFASFRSHLASTSTKEALKVADEAYMVRNAHLTNVFQKFRSYKTWKRRKRSLYPNNLKNWNFGCAKTPRLTDRKRPHISNIGSFTIDQAREFSRQPKSNSSGCLGIDEKGL